MTARQGKAEEDVWREAVKRMGLFTRLAAAAAGVGPIEKGERNKQQGFDFRSIEAITGRARSVFADYGLSLVPSRIVSIHSEPVESKGGSSGWRTSVIVEYVLGCDVDGAGAETVTLQMAGEAVDYGDKSTSKAVQMAYKYALTEALLIGAEADADAESHELAKPQRSGARREAPAAEPTGEQDDLAVFIASQVAAFDRWTVEERRRQWAEAMGKAGLGRVSNREEAERVLVEMAKAYVLHTSQTLPEPS